MTLIIIRVIGSPVHLAGRIRKSFMARQVENERCPSSL